MALPPHELVEIAAMATARPRLLLRVTTATGLVVTVGRTPAATMPADGFRRMVAAAVAGDGGSAAVDSVEVLGAALRAGLLALPGTRVFVTRLSMEQVQACIEAWHEAHQAVSARATVDRVLHVRVVEVGQAGADVSADDLDRAARDLQAACAVDELWRGIAPR